MRHSMGQVQHVSTPSSRLTWRHRSRRDHTTPFCRARPPFAPPAGPARPCSVPTSSAGHRHALPSRGTRKGTASRSGNCPKPTRLFPVPMLEAGWLRQASLADLLPEPLSSGRWQTVLRRRLRILDLLSHGPKRRSRILEQLKKSLYLIPARFFSHNRGFLINLRANCCGFGAAWRAGASEAFMARSYSSPLGGSIARHFGASLP